MTHASASSAPRIQRPNAVRITPTPIGPVTIGAGPSGILWILFGENPDRYGPIATPGAGGRTAGMMAESAERQLRDYFAGSLRAFDLPLDLVGTDFQRKVWRLIREIPYGEQSTYGEIARQLGDSHMARAVGAATGANPVPIVVPCHRVVGADGSLTGYAGGLGTKKTLLTHEARHSLPGLFEERRPDA